MEMSPAFLLLVLLSPLARAFVECEGSCSVQCYPVLWERNLCQFHLQITAWRSTAERCGLSIPAPPPRDPSLPGEQQWEQARQYWDTVLEVWRSEGRDAGVLQEGLVDGSGEAELSGDASSTPDQSQAAWLQLMTSWEQQYTTWNAYARQQNAVEVPQSSSEDILGVFLPDERASTVRSNSRGWSSLVMDWNSAHAAYNDSDVCRS